MHWRRSPSGRTANETLASDHGNGKDRTIRAVGCGRAQFADRNDSPVALRRALAHCGSLPVNLVLTSGRRSTDLEPVYSVPARAIIRKVSPTRSQ